DIALMDVDNDGVLDLLLTSHYSHKSRKGALLWFKGRRNRPWGEAVYLDSTRYWNRVTLIADFDLNGETDLLVGNFWGEDYIIYNVNGERSTKHLPGYTRTSQLIPGDFFPDGLPDILRINVSSLELLKNLGNGDFQLMETEQVFGRSLENIVFADIADFDNDGLPDIFLCLPPSANQVWLNQGDGTFREFAAELHLDKPVVYQVLIADLDGDYDLDIYGLAPGKNAFWQNQQQRRNPPVVQWRGHSNNYALPPFIMSLETDSLSQKVWLAPSSVSPQKSVTLPDNYLALTFSNDEKIKRASHNTQILLLSSDPLWLISLQKNFFRLLYHLHQPTVWFMLFSVLLTLAAALFFQHLGRKFLHWSWRMRQAMLIGTLTLFWMMILLNTHPNVIIRFGIPLLTIIIVNTLPLFTAIPVLRRLTKQNLAEKRYQLLKELMVFSHGEWAIDNLNGLILLLKNFSSRKGASVKIKNVLNERIQTFLELTKPRIAAIIKLGIESAFEKLPFEKLHQQLNAIEDELQKDISEYRHLEIAENIHQMKNRINEIKKTVFQQFSCDAVMLINTLLSERRALNQKNDIRYHLVLEDGGEYNVLMPATQLADILDNLLQNAVKALSGSQKKEIIITIKHLAQLCQISVIDNGPGVHPELREKIFEMAYSGWGSSGKGLALSRKIAESYGGRLFLAEKLSKGGAAFILELTRIEKGN
ncbi:MAG TPA: hypothetical protein ENN84_05770, partial [Candidatus Marinimicrobia bacterium]|nr:hypothetical protein [Candidatus Neomarinimicrobiota bacterium]